MGKAPSTLPTDSEHPEFPGQPMKKPPGGGFFYNGLAYSCGPALRMASETSNFLKFSMNFSARPLAASS